MDNPASILFAPDGTPVATATETPAPDANGLVVRMPEAPPDLKDAIALLQQALDVLAGPFQAQPDTAGRLRVAIESITSSLTLTTLNYLTYMGRVESPTHNMPTNTADIAFADAMRRQITVT
jgi:hypothetical protein